MLIIFDLDDTLIDTSGCIIPFKLKQCHQKLIQQGMIATYEELLKYNASASNTFDGLKEFLLQKKGPLDLLNELGQILQDPLPEGFQVSTTPHATEVLQDLKANHLLALVTRGSPPYQMEKLEKAGIDKTLFSKIAIPERVGKKPFYEALLHEFSYSACETWVCADRVDVDLQPAFELKMNTIHMKWGRGKEKKADWVSHTICDLRELKGILTA